MPAFLKNIGWPELLIIFVLILLFFGGKKMKEVSRGVGESVKEAKKIKDEIKGDKEEE
jgi:sec-independent protein translocase protein TatA